MDAVSRSNFNQLLHAKAPQVVMFDMGDVLVHLDKRRLGLIKVPWWRLVLYMVTHLRSPRFIKKQVLALYRLTPEYQKESWAQELLMAYEEFKLKPIDDGRVVPDLVSVWQRGAISNEQLRSLLQEQSEHAYERGTYKSRQEQMIISELAACLCDAQALAACTKLIPSGIELLQQCAQAGHMVMIVSNWDLRSFDLLRTKFEKEIFRYCKAEHLLVSAQLNMLKPSAPIFMTALSRAREDLPSADSYFFDNEAANVLMARRCGMKGIEQTFK